VARREVEQRRDQRRAAVVDAQQGVPEIEPEVAGDLIIARSSGVEPEPGAPHPADQPQLDGGVDVFIARADAQGSASHGGHRGAQARMQTPVFRHREEPRGAQTAHVSQASQHVPGQQPRIPVMVVPDGVGEHRRVGTRAGRPQRGGLHRRYSSASWA
jgi:hypothetical protein